MKITVEKSVFAEAIAWVLRAVSARATLPALGGVSFETTPTGVRLVGTDLELTAEAIIDCKVEEQGRAVLPGRLLGDIARSLPEGAVRIGLDGTQAKVACGPAEFTLRTLPVEDFPTLPEPAGQGGEIPLDVFVATVGQVTRAASHDEARPVLTGTLLECGKDRVTFVSTDSYRLSVRHVAWAGPSEPLKRIVPARALAEAARAGGDGKITITLGESQASFAVPGRRLTTRLIEGEYPNWSSLIPPEFPNAFRVERDTLAEAVRRVGLLAQSGTPVRVELAAAGATLRAGSQDVGDATELVEGKFEGEGLTVAFNPQYLLDGINAVEGTEVVLSVRDGLKPAVLRAPEDEDYTYLAMPVRVS